MSGKLNLLHILVILSAAACLYYAWQGAQHRTVRLRRSFWAPGLALLAALLLAFFEIAMKQRWWPFPMTLLAGVAMGAAYGLTMKMRIEDYWLVVQSAGRRIPFWIALVLAAAVLVDVVCAWWGPDARVYRFPTALIALWCAGLLWGRALALTSRLWHLNR
jgi:hypothetical protein